MLISMLHKAPVSPYPSPPIQYGRMPGGGYSYAYAPPNAPPIGLHPGQGYPGPYPGQYPPNETYAGQASPNMYAPPGQSPNAMQVRPGQNPQMEHIPHNSNMGYTAHNGVKVEKQEADKHWYDLDDGKKSALASISYTNCFYITTLTLE